MSGSLSLDLDRVFDDFEYFCENCLKVQDLETLQFVPLRLKPVQLRLARAIVDDLKHGRPARYIVLKARREGVSTVVQAIFFWLAVTKTHQQGMTLSHHDQTTGELFGMSERFFQWLPRGIRPMRRRSRAGAILELANPSSDPDVRAKNPGNESILRTVTFKNAGAGQAANLVHCSEVGLWGNEAETTLSTLLPVVPTSGGTVIVLESTARGVGNAFHKQWIRAERGLSQFTPFFIPWFEEPFYREKLVEPLEDLDDEELQLRSLGVDDEQLLWRRNIGIPGQTSLDQFHQEYPSTPEEAFLASGRPYFDQKSVVEEKKRAETAEILWQGDLAEDPERKPSIYPVPSARGLLKIWEMPLADEDYLIACDSSEGSKQHDPQCAYVLARSTLRIVAGWHGYVDRAELGDVLYRIGRVYNDALIAVELSGGWGETPQAILRRRGYPRLYRRRDENKSRALREKKFGWNTTQANRAIALDALRDALLNEELSANDPDLLSECLTFVIDETGKPCAEPGAHDDRVMTAAIATYLWQSEPRIKRSAFVVPVPPRRPMSGVTGY